MYKMFYSIQNINNGILIAKKAMPLKDHTSTNESSFAMARNTYAETFPAVVQPTIQKKWFGNRDASQVTANRRNMEVGVGSMNVGPTNDSRGPISFTTKDDKNYTQRALNRVRSGGAVAPAKKNANTNNAPVPYYAPLVIRKINMNKPIN